MLIVLGDPAQAPITPGMFLLQQTQQCAASACLDEALQPQLPDAAQGWRAQPASALQSTRLKPHQCTPPEADTAAAQWNICLKISGCLAAQKGHLIHAAGAHIVAVIMPFCAAQKDDHKLMLILSAFAMLVKTASKIFAPHAERAFPLTWRKFLLQSGL